MTAGEYYVVTADATYKRLIAPSGTAANLILCDGTTLNAQITISKGCSLNIYCQSGGTGEWKNGNGGTVTIHGGTVTA